MGSHDLPSDLQGLNKLFHEPARLSIVGCLYALAEADFSFLSQQLGLTVGNLSFHLSRLEDAGMVRITKGYLGKVPLTTAALTSGGRKAFKEYRKILRGFLQSLPE
jgi:DNA-binding transcriptional ArsR family regulator